MIKYSIVIPVYDRIRNLKCCLMALLRQTLTPDNWEVIVVDSGTSPAIENLPRKYREVMNLRYLWMKDETGNPGPKRNWAAKLARSDCLIFVDSDVILNDKALSAYDRLHTQYPESIICGRYDWLIPMNVTEEMVAGAFDQVVSNQLPQIAPITAGPIPGADPRWCDVRTKLWNKPSSLSPITGKPFALGMFSGNLLIPKGLFQGSGGFDEKIVGHGGEDCALGWALHQICAKAFFTEETIGWHLWHVRNQAENEQSVKKNIKYIEEKYRAEHIKYGIIAAPEKNIIYNDDGTFVGPEQRKELGI